MIIDVKLGDDGITREFGQDIMGHFYEKTSYVSEGCLNSHCDDCNCDDVKGTLVVRRFHSHRCPCGKGRYSI